VTEESTATYAEDKQFPLELATCPSSLAFLPTGLLVVFVGLLPDNRLLISQGPPPVMVFAAYAFKNKIDRLRIHREGCGRTVKARRKHVRFVSGEYQIETNVSCADLIGCAQRPTVIFAIKQRSRRTRRSQLRTRFVNIATLCSQACMPSQSVPTDNYRASLNLYKGMGSGSWSTNYLRVTTS